MSEQTEGRVAEYLGELRDSPPGADPELTRTIVRHARWQQAVRTPIKAVGALGAAFGDGLALVLGLRRRDP